MSHTDSYLCPLSQSPARLQHDKITKKDFMKYFDEELAARIEMRDIASVQERIKRFDCADD